MPNCLNCKKSTNNPKFCCHSCAATHNNKCFPKRSIEPHNKCISCGSRLLCSKSQRKTDKCRKCYDQERMIHYGMKTKKESVDESIKYAAKHKYEKIRQYGKRLAKHFGWNTNTCEQCGYDKHAELCHINPIADFPDETLVRDINDRSNVKFLCPNCHWELDHLK